MSRKLLKIIGIVLTLMLVATLFAACSSTPKSTEEKEPAEEVAKPSNPGGPGKAVDLTGDATAGEQVFTQNCVSCHGDQGKGGIENAGSDDGTVPELNPIDATMKSSDAKTFATNIDLFIEHGSTPTGTSPALSMPAFGDQGTLTAQQIADVIAYVISLNK